MNGVFKIFRRSYAQTAKTAKETKAPVKKLKQRHVRVTILGSDTDVGEATALLLKQNPLITQLHVYGEDSAATGADLRHLDTRCKVISHHGKNGLPKALRAADLILLMGDEIEDKSISVEEELKLQGKRIIELAEACSRHAPKSMLVVCAPPVSMTLPLVANVFRRTHWYHPGRLVGTVALPQVRANSLTARFQDLDPTSVHVPLIGGPDLDTLVPLFSRATPVGLMMNEAEFLMRMFRGVAEDRTPLSNVAPCKLADAPLSEAYALNRLVTTIAMGMKGDSAANAAACLRSGIISTCKHMVSTVRFGKDGVVHNYGLPKLTRYELELLQDAVLVLKKREDYALEFLNTTEIPAGVNVMSARASRRGSSPFIN